MTTLGGFTPLVPLHLLPTKKQLWWKPCLTRGEGGDTHCWYLSETSDGSLFCHQCRFGRPRVFVGPKGRVEAIQAALDAGDLRRAQQLAFANAPLEDGDDEEVDPGPWRPAYRNRADWEEWRRERAGVFEFMGGMPRKEAEAAANELAGPPP